MKNPVKISMLFAVITLFSFGCKKEYPELKHEKYIEYSGMRYGLDVGILELHEEMPDLDGVNGYFHQLNLAFSDNESLPQNENGATVFDETEIHLFLILVSSTSDGLDEGEYVFTNQEVPERGEIANGYYEFKSNPSAGEIKGGKLSLSIEDGEYTINFDLTNEDGELIKGYYKGLVKENKIQN